MWKQLLCESPGINLHSKSDLHKLMLVKLNNGMYSKRRQVDLCVLGQRNLAIGQAIAHGFLQGQFDYIQEYQGIETCSLIISCRYDCLYCCRYNVLST